MRKVNHAHTPRWKRLGLSAGVALTLFLALLLAEGFSKGAFAQPLVVSSSGTMVPVGVSTAANSAIPSALRLSAPEDPTEGLRATLSDRGAATVAAAPLPVLAPSPAPALQGQPLCSEQVAGVTGFLSTTTSISNQPSSSRTGRQLAFWSTSNLPNNGNNADGNIEIFLINLAGGAPRRDIQMTSSSGSILGGFNLSPSISDDGSRIAFFSDRDLDTTNRGIDNRDSNFEIFFADIANGEVTRIFQVTETTRGGNILPSISADGSRIAFASDDNPNGTNPENNQEIFVATILSNTLDLIQVTHTDSTVTNDQPVLSGNAERVIFTSNRDEHGNIEIFRAAVEEASDVVQVTYTIEGIINDQPAVDEFGNTVAFVSNGAAEEIDLPTATAGNLDVFVASIGQSGDVTVAPVTSTQLPPSGDPPTSEQPSISADGTRVAFTSNGDFANNNPDALEQIFVYDTFFGEEIAQLTRSRRDPRNPGLLIFNDQPSISGDSATVTFVSNRNGNRDLYQTICPFADLAVTIGASEEVTAGNSLTYQYTVTNFGPVTATNIVVTDTIPVGTNFNGPASPGWTCSGQQCTYPIGTLSGEEEQSVGTLVIDVPSNRQDGVTLTNSIAVGSTVLDRNTTNNFDSIVTTVTRRSSLDMTIQVSDNPILPGTDIVYTLVLSNAGPSDAFNIVMTDTLPPHTTFQSASGGGVQVSPGVVRWTLASLQAGNSIQRTVTVEVAATLPGGVNNLVNIGNALDEDGNTAPASLETPILAEPQLDVEKTTPNNPVEPNDLVQYTLNVENTGNQAATGVILTDRLPAFTTFQSQTGGGTHDGSPEGGVISWSLGTIPANGTASRTVTVRVRPTIPTMIDAITNETRVADDGRNAGSGVISDTDILDSVLFAEPNFSLTKLNGVGQVEPGDTIPYQITLTNIGNQDATAIVISDTLPPETSFVSVSPGGTHDGSSTGGEVTWLPFDLAAGANRTFTVTVQVITPVPQGANDIVNVSRAQDNGINSTTPISATDFFTNDLLAGPLFTLTKSDGLTTVVPGQTTTYAILIRNDGNQGATNVELSDLLPISDSVEFIGATGNITPSGGSLTWPLFDLAAGASRQFTVTVMVTSPAPINVNEIVNYAAAVDDGTNSEGIPVTASVSDTNTLDAAPTLSIIKTDNRTQVMPDERVTYDITVSNNGNQAAGGVVITDTLPPDTIYVPGSASPSGTYVTATQQIIWPIGILTPGQTVTHTFALTTETSLNLARLINRITVDDDGTNGPDASDTFTETNTLVRSLIGGLVWEDVNANGIQDVGEPGIPNVVVNLPTAGSAPANRSTMTDANGVYTFTNVVQDNDYVLEFVRPTGFLYTLQDATANDQLDSDPDPVTGLTDPFSVMNPARLDFSRDAGFYRAVSIGDYVWEDEDGDGVQDGSEPPLGGVEVTLYDDLTNSVVLSTTTNVSGTYTFNDVVPGDYYIVFTAPISYTFTFRDRGGDDTVDNDADATGTTATFTVVSGQTTTVWDAGLYKPIVIGNLVWEDQDGDGLQDAVEPGIPNITVTLYHSPTNAIARTTTTLSDGTYIFVNLSPGYYYAEFTDVPPYSFTQRDVGMNDTIDSDADPVTGRTGNITVRSGEITLSWDAGMYEVSSVGDYVWEDTDGDGVQDGGEPPLAGATVELYRASDNALIGSDITDANGAYSISNIPPTNYYLDFVPPGGYFLTQQDQGGDDTTDSDANPSTGQTATFLITSAQADTSRDAGMYRPATVGDYVWVDLDADGVQEGGENGLQNVTVHVRRASDNVSVGSTTTNASGNYSIGNIPPGNYYVQFTPPVGFLFTTQDQGSDSTDSDANIVTGRTASFALITNQTVNTWDAGLFRTATVSDFVWEDLNGNGIQGGGEPGLGGVTIGLYRDVDDTLVMTTTSAANGSYVMTNIRPDTYYLRFTPTVGYFLTQKDQGGNDANDSDPDPVTGQTDPFPLISNESNSTLDAGMYQLATVGNLVWEDRDGDGIQEGGEPGIPGATALLRRASDNSIVVTDTTGFNGRYSLPGGVSGVNYYVEFILPPTYSFTQQDQGGDDNLDSDPNPATGRTANFTLTSNQLDNSRDAGAYRPATVGDFVWQEISYDGVQDVGELGVTGVQVSIRRSSDNGVVGSDTTDANGAYAIGNVPPGSYYLVFTPPPNAAFTFQDATTDTLDSDVNLLGQTAVFSVLSNEVTTDWDAGLIAGATIGDFVWEDDDGDGIQDGGGETGLAGATVSLHLSLDDSVVATDTTDANGAYIFTNLQPNSYYLVFNPPGGYLRTQQNQGGNDAVDSDANPATGQTSTFLISLGQVTTIWDAGMYLPAVVGNFVWRDTNASGDQNMGEPGVSGVAVGLYRADTTFVASTTTNGSGNYSFSGLTTGDYYLVFTPTVGLVLTHQDADVDDDDSDPDQLTRRTATFNLSPGETDNNWDAGLVTPASIGNRVWEDSDGDGIQDGGETGGVPGATVNLHRLGDGLLAGTATTDANGNFTISNVPPAGNGVDGYYLDFILPGGYFFTLLDQGGDGNLDSDANQTTGESEPLELTQGENATNWDAGAYRLGTVGDRVWEDTNGNGIQNGGELGITGVTVNVRRASDNGLLGTATTNASGNYAIGNLIPGVSYYVQFVLPGGYNFAPANQGGDDTVDSDPNTGTGNTANFTINSNQTDNRWDAGMFRPATIGDRVWEDTNVNGIQDVGELGIATVTVRLRRTSDNVVLGTTTTNASGIYSLSGTPGVQSYLEFTLPGGYFFTLQDQGGDDAQDSDPNTGTGRTANFTPTSNQTDSSRDAGMYRHATISDRVWEDLNGNGIQDGGEPGIQNVSVRVHRTSDNGQVGATATTNASGNYSIGSIPPGVSYYVHFTLPGGYQFTLRDVGADDTVDSDANPADGRTSNFTPTSNQTDTSRDAGMHRVATISDFVWEDTNGDGIQNGGETTDVIGVTVNVRRVSDNSIAGTDLTDSNGYSIQVAPGSYYVEFILPGGYNFSPQDQGGNDTTDSDPNLSGITANFAVTSNQTVSTWDAGMFRFATVGNFVWDDTDDDGRQDAGEPGVAGVTVELRRASDNSLLTSGVTNPSGNYSLNAPPGVYYIVVIAPMGRTFTTQDQPGGEGADSDVNASGRSANITLDSNEVDDTWDAGFATP